MTTYTGLKVNDTSTLQGILQSIYFLGKCNASTFDANEYLRIINIYYAKLQEVVRAVNENFYMEIATTDLVIGDGTYTFPDGTGTAKPYEKIKSIWVAFQPANLASPLPSEYVRCDIIDPDSISDPEYIFSADSPKAQMFGKYFVLQPLVTDVTKYPVTDGVKMYYIATQDKLILDTDVPQIFPSFHPAIVTGALIDIHKRLGDDVASERCKKDFADQLEEIKNYASAHIPPEIGVVEGQDEQGGWEYPFGFNSMA